MTESQDNYLKTLKLQIKTFLPFRLGDVSRCLEPPEKNNLCIKKSLSKK